jgi:preprotein translocase subunit SecE
MATKMAIEKGDDRSAKRQEPGALAEFSGNAVGAWSGFTRFLSDVRAEMRKVVAPSLKEVKVTTTVVIIAVFIFGVFFMVSDWVFRIGVNGLLNKLGGMQ